MSINLKNSEQISKMQIAGKLAAEVIEMIEPFVVPESALRNWIIDVTNSL